MKYVLIFLSLSACQFSSKNETPAVESRVSTILESPADTIVPAKFDTEKHLVRLSKSDAEWKRSLSEMEYYVLREEGTERAFTGDLLKNHETGTYTCRGCGLPLFASDTKFNSGTGWPSFWKSINPDYVAEVKDSSFGMMRTEVECARCGGHLGHVFDDGPKPTGLRYCINSVSLDFVKE
ncbi:MAG: peptide-methionine (R)-S-oxide reductase MsrB [Lewinellaceae bacterium]|nr:peptide-methionine (R)-S-oxide reductase MsrB [Lewinellaceae bacterium]